MTKNIALVVLAALSGTPSIVAAQRSDYSVETFSMDCILSGGKPQIFQSSATCEGVDGQHITCLLQDDAVGACKLESPSSGQTPTSIQREFLNRTQR